MSSLSVGLPIGAGAYGSVYHAFWQGRKVAIKKFTVTLADAARESAIEREIRLLESLRDKHIIQFYGTAEHEGRLVLVMEYAEGGSLEGAIQGGTLDWPAKERIAQEVARGLAYIHHMGVVHRDLKSMNVLLTRHMEVKLCDFGLATVKIRSSSMSTSSKGTTRWMAPELFTARPKYSTKSDVFALGMVMWEMAANCTIPFQEQIDNYTVISLVKAGEREELPEDTPSDYRQWVERCWDQDPAERPEAGEMVTKDVEQSPVNVHRIAGCGSTVHVTATMTGGLVFLPSPRSLLSDGDPSETEYAPHTANTTTTLDIDEVDALLTRANAGDSQAQLDLAVKYEKGIDVDQDDAEAFKWYLRAAAQGSTEAQYRAGDSFRTGRGTNKNDTVAAYWLQQAAESGHALAQYGLGRLYMHGVGVVERDDEQAAAWFRKAAEQGDAVAECSLGCMYMNGQGVEQDYDEALTWFRRSAEQGNASAWLNLGRVYYNGHGVPQDYDEAVVCYRMAADQGNNTVAQNTLGWMYLNGHGGVERDFGLALSYYRKSAEQGDAVAECSLGWMCQNGHGVEQDCDQAVSWYRKSADQGNMRAECSLGWMYQNGHGVEQDFGQALSWYQKSADHGSAMAQCHLGWMYQNGLGVECDYGQAALWFHKSADQGNVVAQNNLGWIYENGYGVEQDFAQAASWYRRSAEQGHPDAQYNLALMYQNGHGVSKDIQQSEQWCRKAASQGHASAIDQLRNVEEQIESSLFIR